MFNIILFIILFLLLIVPHELGHLFFAKFFKVGVPSFGVGMGKRLISFKIGETIYGLHLLPIGGFCEIDGLDNEKQGKKSFLTKQKYKKISIILAGVFMNIVVFGLCFLYLRSQHYFPHKEMGIIVAYVTEAKYILGIVGLVFVFIQLKMTFNLFIFFLGFLSLNIGLVNLLPIPPLDGFWSFYFLKKRKTSVRKLVKYGTWFLILTTVIVLIADIAFIFRCLK